MGYNSNEFKSVFKNDITNYLNEKELLKQRTKNLFYYLRNFDELCFQLKIESNILTKELVLKWLEKKPNESKNNQSKRASILRCFGKFLYRYNCSNYIVPKLLYPVKERYKPHIYTKDEIKRLFNVIDNLEKTNPNDNKPDVMPIIYRILLFTGMRINEVLSLKIEDIKFDEQLIFVKNAKNHKDRLIPISDNLLDYLIKYKSKRNFNKDKSNYLFINCEDNKISVDSFYDYFRSYLWKARIPHTGKGPRVHDFRFTFTVNCIHKWLLEKKDIKVLLPYLQTYLGHGSIEATYYYYHMTLGLYPYLEEKLAESTYSIIPKLPESDFDE